MGLGDFELQKKRKIDKRFFSTPPVNYNAADTHIRPKRRQDGFLFRK
jgi:hypothetical protein